MVGPVDDGLGELFRRVLGFRAPGKFQEVTGHGHGRHRLFFQRRTGIDGNNLPVRIGRRGVISQHIVPVEYDLDEGGGDLGGANCNNLDVWHFTTAAVFIDGLEFGVASHLSDTGEETDGRYFNLHDTIAIARFRVNEITLNQPKQAIPTSCEVGVFGFRCLTFGEGIHCDFFRHFLGLLFLFIQRTVGTHQLQYISSIA